jgi:ABC-type transport system involved in multi-copper enzyme maturation permease subunit
MTSRIRTIAREDVRHVLRDRLLWGALVLVFLLTVPLFWQVLGGHSSPIEDIANLAYNLRIYVAILAGVIAVKSVVGERESGTVRLLLGLPGTRRDVVLGKLISRVSMVIVVLLMLFVSLAGVLLLRAGGQYLVVILPVALWTLLYGAAWTGLTVGASAAFDSWYRTLAAFGVTYIVFSPAVRIWETLVLPLLAVPFTGTVGVGATSSLGTGMAPVWYQYVGRLNPIASYVLGSVWVTDPNPSTIGPNLFGVLVLLFFGTIPLLVGYRRFERADLG